MSLKHEADRDVVIRRSVGEVKRWDGVVESLLQTFHLNEEAPPSLGCKLEGLRNKRDTLANKIEALKRHRTSGWGGARRELDDARQELREAWRSVIGTLDKENLLV